MGKFESFPPYSQSLFLSASSGKTLDHENDHNVLGVPFNNPPFRPQCGHPHYSVLRLPDVDPICETLLSPTGGRDSPSPPFVARKLGGKAMYASRSVRRTFYADRAKAMRRLEAELSRPIPVRLPPQEVPLTRGKNGRKVVDQLEQIASSLEPTIGMSHNLTLPQEVLDFMSQFTSIMQKVDVDDDISPEEAAKSIYVKGVNLAADTVIGRVKASMSSSFETLRAFLSEHSNQIALVVILVLIAYVCMNDYAPIIVVTVTVSLAGMLMVFGYEMLTAPIIATVFSFIAAGTAITQSLCSDSGLGVTPTAGEPVNFVTDLIVTAFSVAAGVRNDGDFISRVRGCIKGHTAFKSDLGSFTESILSMIQKTLHVVCEWAGVASPSIVSTDLPLVDGWIQSAIDLIDRHRRGKLPQDIRTCEDIVALHRKGCDIQSSMAGKRETAKASSKMSSYIRSLNLLVQEYERLGLYIKGNRQKPLVFMLRGGTGCGKSTMIRPLMADLLPRIVDAHELKALEEDLDSFIYVRIPEHGFWDGYRRQFVCVFDEFGVLSKNLIESENCFMDLIRNGQTFQSILHMADLTNKGSMSFSSLVIPVTSNIGDIGNACTDIVVYPDAVVRRFAFDFVVVPKKEYCTADSVNETEYYKRLLDTSRVDPDLAFDKNVYEIYDAKGCKHPSEYAGPYSYDDVVDMLEKKFMVYKNEMVSFCAYEKKSLSEAIAKRRLREGIEPTVGIGARDYISVLRTLTSMDPLEYGYVLRILEYLRYCHPDGDVPLDLIDDYDFFKDTFKLPEEGLSGEYEQAQITFTKLSSMPGWFIALCAGDKFFDTVCGAYNKGPCGDDDIVEYAHNLVRFVVSARASANNDSDDEDYSVDSFWDEWHSAEFAALSWPTKRRLYWECLSRNSKQAYVSFKKYIGDLVGQFDTWLDQHPILRAFFQCMAAGAAIKLGVTIATKLFNLDSGRTVQIDSRTHHWYAHRPEVVAEQATQPTGASQLADNVDVDKMCTEIQSSVTARNVYMLSDEERTYGFGTFIKSKFMMYPNHFLDCWKVIETSKPGSTITLTSVSEPHTIIRCPLEKMISQSMVMRSMDTAVSFIQNTVHHKDITHFFLPIKEMGSRTSGFMLWNTIDHATFNERAGRYSFRQTNRPLDIKGKEVSLSIKRSILYHGGAQFGDCGTLVYLVDTTTRSQKIIGFNVAGNSKRDGLSVATLLDVHAILAGMEKSFPTEWTEAQQLQATMGVVKRSPSYTVPTGVGFNSTSSIRKSPCYGAWGPAIKCTSKLRPYTNRHGEYINPYIDAVENLFLEKPQFDMEIMSVCADHLYASLINNSPIPFEQEFLTWDEAIFGRDGDIWCSSIERNTSPGYPFCLDKTGMPGKQQFMGDGINTFTGPDLIPFKQLLDKQLDTNKRGIRSNHVFVISLKDEKLLKEKAERSTRSFAAGPIDLLVKTRKYFHCYETWIIKNRVYNGIAMGINPFSAEWDLLARQITSVGENVLEGDFSKFDKKMHVDVMRLAFKVIMRMFNVATEDRIAMEVLCEEVCVSHQLLGDQVFVVEGTNPSGNFFTTLLNCLTVHLYARYAYIKCHGGDIASLLSFKNHVSIIAQGDDMVGAVSDLKKDIYNNLTMAGEYQAVGLKYTASSKGDVLLPYRSLTESTFLKRTFRYSERFSRYLAPLDLATILEIPYWTQKGALYLDISKTNIDVAVSELSLHDEDVYQKWAWTIIGESSKRLQYMPEIFDYHTLMALTCGFGREWGIRFKGKPMPYLTLPTILDYDRLGKNKTEKLTDPKCEFKNCPANVTALDGALTANILSTRCALLDLSISSVKKQTANFELEPTMGETNSDTPNQIAATAGRNAFIENEEGADQTIGITDFLEDGAVLGKQTTDGTTLDEELVSIMKIGTPQDVKTFLNRPIVIRTGTWLGSTGPSFTLESIFPFYNTVELNSMFADKVSGYLGIRATVHIRLEINSAPTQSGMLMMTFHPMGHKGGMNHVFKTRDLRAYSQLPNVILDLAETTTVTLTIPYVNSDLFYNLIDGSGEVGIVNLVTITPLRTGTGGSTDAVYRIMAYLTDVELSAPIEPTMGKRKTVGRHPSEVEADDMDEKPISSSLRIASQAAGMLARIPLLSSIAGPASWAMGVSAGVASAFGYSKPGNETAVSRMQTNGLVYAHNYDGIDMGANMGLSCQNKTSIISGFAGSNMDETSFDYILSIPTFIRVDDWNDSAVAGQNLYEENIYPQMRCDVGTTTSNLTPYYCTPLGYFGNMFSLWRGSMIITFRIARTNQHSGKLRFSYAPGSVDPISDAAYLMSDIIDVRNGAEWSFTLPYVSQSLWKRTGGFKSQAEVDTEDCLGRVKLEVFNPIRRPSTVTGSLSISIWISAGPDFEFAAPTMPVMFPQYDGVDFDLTPTMGDAAKIMTFMKPVGNFESNTSCLPVATEKGTGEKVTSALQLLKKFTRIRNFNEADFYNQLMVKPFDIISIPSTVSQPRWLAGDFYPLIATCYALAKGSIRMKMFPMGNLSQGWTFASIYPYRQTSGALGTKQRTDLDNPNFGYQQNYNCSTQAIFRNDSINPVEVTVPPYTVNVSRINTTHAWDTTALPDDNYKSPVRMGFDFSNQYVTKELPPMMRAVGEDFQLGYFCGVPPLVVFDND